MTTAYPGTIDAFVRPLPGTARNDPTTPHAAQHDNAYDAIEAIETKLGTGISTAVANRLLRGTGTGATAWGQLVNADVDAAAAIAISKLASGSAGQVIETVSSVPTWRTVPSARVYHNANQSISAGSEQYLAFNSERWDTASLHDTSTFNSRLTAPIAGKYLILGVVQWSNAPSSAACVSQIRINRTTNIVIDRLTLPVSAQVTQAFLGIWDMAATDYAELVVAQFTSGAAQVDASAAQSPEFMMLRLAA